MAFISTFITTAIEAIILGAVAVVGVKLGKKLRDNKDAKTAGQ